MHPAGNWLTVCEDCQGSNQTAEPTGQPVRNLPNGHRAP
jgi:hypothetical protein